MRIRTFSVGLALFLASSSFATDVEPTTSAPVIVYLDGPSSLAALQKANPTHYARAERIIAAANELCRPGPLEGYLARFEAREISCVDKIFKTSNPPKKELAFTLDAVHYVALVAITDSQPKIVPLAN